MREILEVGRRLAVLYLSLDDGSVVDAKAVKGLHFEYDHWAVTAWLVGEVGGKKVRAPVQSLEALLATLLEQERIQKGGDQF